MIAAATSVAAVNASPEPLSVAIIAPCLDGVGATARAGVVPIADDVHERRVHDDRPPMPAAALPEVGNSVESTGLVPESSLARFRDPHRFRLRQFAQDVADTASRFTGVLGG